MKGSSGNRLGCPSRFFASRGVFGAPGDDGLQGQIVLVRGLAEVGVEAVVADGQRVVVGAGLLVLLLPDAAALDQLAARGAAEDAVRGGHRVRARDGFDRDVEVEGQGRDGADALGGFDVGAGEFDAVRGHCSSPCLRCNDGHLAAGQGPATPKAKRSGEGQAPVFLFRAEWPAGTGEKDRRQPLWTGRQLRPACHATQTKGEVRWPRRKVGEQPREMRQWHVKQ